jgi:molybdate transport system substrate-binding protein
LASCQFGSRYGSGVPGAIGGYFFRLFSNSATILIAGAMAKKLIFKPALDGGVQLVVTGQAEIDIYPASEVAGVKGLTVVGPLPMDIDLEIVYGAAVTTNPASPNAASAFVKFMAAPENRSVWKEAGFEPPAKSKRRRLRGR